jgi:hypothetical protein
MICLLTAIAVAYLIEPGFTYVLLRLLNQIPLIPPFLDRIPLFVAAVAMLLMLAVTWILQRPFTRIRFPRTKNPHSGVSDEI